MKPIGMPAKKLTADCIWNSFRSSGKRHLILTGGRGSGKTTLLGRLFPQKQPGITTWAKPRQGVYLQENRTGETAQVGVFDENLPGPENRMALLRGGFTGLGTAALRRCAECPEPWVTVDEVGYLESVCEEYRAALNELMEKKQTALAVRKQELPFLQGLCRREDAFVVDLDDPFGNIGCVIMASGLGRRFGGNKLMADFHGRPMIHCILDAAEGIFSQCVAVTRHEDVARLCKARGIPAILHDLPYRNDTVRLGLAAMPDVERCLFTPADQPLLRRDTLAALALASKNEPSLLWRTEWEGTPGSPVVFPAWTFDALADLPQGKGGGVVIKKYPEHVRTVHVRDMAELRDVDSPEDLKELLER